ncbi:hypothetical protein LPB140_04995 [Sphingorhabdus lutea]|uniref:Cytochrome b561 bacterial/Ni-hydrogenase domain-containing protein n=1 Tax=Sphingorhabdus lutea TaxID=1913578 RepID=A0A1L3JAX1_9SPHN|nr:cytochrome b [Sphingorhabdus lutea]APG62266.1 hypothetical protein LPB140_04995 [Sphingorhabdus lutea]
MTKYSKIAILLHWIIAAAIITNIGLAELTEDLGKTARAPYMDLHKSLGICILFFSLFRLYWRVTHKRPAPMEQISGWETSMAKAAHFIFYALMIGLPLGGWLWMSTYPAPINMFGLFDMPVLPVVGNKALADIAHEGHEIGGKAMLILIVLHLLGALKHQFIERLPLLQRMMP